MTTLDQNPGYEVRVMTQMKFVAKAEAGKGWRVWNRRTRRWWGNYLNAYPEDLLAELNGERRPEKIVELTNRYLKRKRA